MQFAEEVREFLIESNENLATLDREIVELEKSPDDADLVASVFRTIHTIKGTCGFFGFDTLGAITHLSEHILGQVRARERRLTPDVVSLTLQTVDVVRQILGRIEATGEEGANTYDDLKKRLVDASEACNSGQAPSDVELVQPTHHSNASSASDITEMGSASSAGVESDSPSASSGSESRTSTIRVDVNLLDKLMNLVGELVLARNQILQRGLSGGETSAGASQQLNLITSELQESVMRTRMQPIGVVWNKLPRVVRDLAAQLNKSIEVRMQGSETDLDKTIIEAIKDPLTHIVRNACDHGIETSEERIRRGKNPRGTIHLRAYHEGGHVNIEISDDGGGIDPEKLKNKALQKDLVRPEQLAQMSDRDALRLIFLPGFSTAETLTNISGRGVGMDVVKTNIEKIGGTVDLQSQLGAGTSIKIKIPLTLAIIPGLVVTLNTPQSANPHAVQRFVIPQANLLELVRLESREERERIRNINGTEVYQRRGKLLPLVHLRHVLCLPSADAAPEVMSIVVLHADEIAFGLVVDGISDTQEIVVKALGRQLKDLSCYFGATVMGDGKIALILDVSGLARLAGVATQHASSKKLPQNVEDRQSGSSPQDFDRGNHQTLLLFRAGRSSRLVVPLSLVARLEEFPCSQIEFASGAPVLHYRGTILPLISMDKVLDPAISERMFERELLQVIVFSEGGRRVGLVVDEILDILEEAVTVRKASTCHGLLGSGVVGGKVTDFVDMGAILSAAAVSFPDQTDGAAHKKLLVAEPSRILSGALRSYLEMHGYSVVESATLKDALNVVQDTSISAVLAGAETHGFGREMLKAVRGRESHDKLPVLGVTTDGSASGGAEDLRFDAVVSWNERGALLAAIERSSAIQEPEAALTGYER